jgi:hypothetical protein
MKRVNVGQPFQQGFIYDFDQVTQSCQPSRRAIRIHLREKNTFFSIFYQDYFQNFLEIQDRILKILMGWPACQVQTILLSIVTNTDGLAALSSLNYTSINSYQY